MTSSSQIKREAGLKKKKCSREACQEKETSTESGWNDIGSRNSDDIRKSLSGEKGVSSLWLQSCRQEGLSRFRNVRSKPDQEKVAALDKDVESKKCQGQRLPRDHAVDGRASQAVRRCSYRLSLVFKGSSLSRNFRHPACPGSTSIAWCCRYCKHVRTLGDAWARCCTGGSSWLRGRQWQYKRWSSCTHLQINEPRITDSIAHILNAEAPWVKKYHVLAILMNCPWSLRLRLDIRNIFNDAALASAIDAQPPGSETAAAGYLGANQRSAGCSTKSTLQAQAVLDLSIANSTRNWQDKDMWEKKRRLQSSQLSPSQHRLGGAATWAPAASTAWSLPPRRCQPPHKIKQLSV